MQNILVATDLSPAGDRALERGILLSRQTGAHLCVLHVLPGLLPAGLFERRAAEARRHIHTRLSGLAPDRIDDVTVDVRSGETARCIVRHAEDIGADLTVVGTSSARPLLPFLRPIRRRVLCDGMGALLVVRDDVRDYYHRTVFATDNGIDHASAAAAVRKIVPNTAVEYVRARRPALTHRSDAAADVVDAKRENAADLVAVSVERQESFLRVPFRSLALAVVGQATCDTLVVPAA